MTTWMWSRILAVTENGYVGIMPRIVQTGDVVAIILLIQQLEEEQTGEKPTYRRNILAPQLQPKGPPVPQQPEWTSSSVMEIISRQSRVLVFIEVCTKSPGHAKRR